ncbi:MAG TPA: helix-turn-helix domain-containing protein [Chloroflexota bacterium]|nr:helix-turn-helix domain-containing protein [Chloroflexota bacterium]
MTQASSEGFNAGRAAKLSGVPYRTLDYWATSRFLVPSLVSANGKGSLRLYSFSDVVALRVAMELRNAGISLQRLRKVVRHLRSRRKSASFANTFLVSDGKDVFERRGDEIISTLRRPGQLASAWLVDLGQIVEELERAANS